MIFSSHALQRPAVDSSADSCVCGGAGMLLCASGISPLLLGSACSDFDGLIVTADDVTRGDLPA